jgi:hypothetical protein
MGRRFVWRATAILSFAFLLCISSGSFAEQVIPLTVERPPDQTIVLTEGFSTTVRSERPFGKISITNPDIVDLVLRTDKSAVLIPGREGQTNVDFLDDAGNLIGRINVVVSQKKSPDRVLVYDRPSLGAYSAYHCQRNGCESFEEIPAKEQAAVPLGNEDHRALGATPIQ